MRHEKKLLALPVPPCPPLAQRERERATPHSWRYFIRYAAEVHSVDGDEVLDLLEGASRGLISRGGLPAHSFRDMVEVNVIGGEEALHVVLSMEDGLFAVYQDPDWSYAIREGEALAAAVEALLPA